MILDLTRAAERAPPQSPARPDRQTSSPSLVTTARHASASPCVRRREPNLTRRRRTSSPAAVTFGSSNASASMAMRACGCPGRVAAQGRLAARGQWDTPVTIAPIWRKDSSANRHQRRFPDRRGRGGQTPGPGRLRSCAPPPISSGRRDSLVANAMADSEHAPMSEAIVGTATGQLAIESNAGS
jgi:hypothetical protein